MIHASALLKSPPAECSFHVVYFSSEKHLSYLLLSIKSWQRAGYKALIKNIEICLDASTTSLAKCQDQISIAAADMPFHISITQEPMSRSGSNVVRNELRAFQALSECAADQDWIVKVDSDVLVTNVPYAFDVAYKSKAALFGNGYSSYIQGGVYFLRAREVYRLTVTSLETNSYCKRAPLHCPEDAVITEQMHRGCGIVEQIAIVWNQPTLDQISALPVNHTFLHFGLTAKKHMPEAYELLFGRSGPSHQR